MSSVTPAITDLANPGFLPPADLPSAPTRKRRVLLHFLISGAIGFGLSFGGVRFAETLEINGSALFPEGGGALTVIFGITVLLIAFWLHAVLHEAGHALAGIAGGMRPLAFGIGPLRLERGAEGWHLRWGGSLGAVSGFALLLPRPDHPPNRLAQAFYLLGGPLANLGIAAVAFVAVLWVPSGPVQAPLLALMVTGTLLGLINLIPFRTGGWLTDGAGLLSLWRRPGLALASMRLQQIVQSSIEGQRPRDWPVALLTAPSAPFGGLDEPAVDVGLAALRISRALDGGDATEAESGARFLLALWPSASKAMRPGMAAVLAEFCLLQRGVPAEIRAWRERMDGVLLDTRCHQAWIDAELALLDGDTEAAREAYTRAVAALPRIHDAGTRRVVAEHLDGLAMRLAVPLAV